MIKIYNLDVGQADCILVHCEEGDKSFNLLVDGATKKSDIKNKLDAILDKGDKREEIQGVVLTHIDNDHISGLLDLMENNYPKIKNSFFIYNKFDSQFISYKQAKDMEKKLETAFKSNIVIRSYDKQFEEIETSKGHNCLSVKIRSFDQRVMMDRKIDENVVNITILSPSKERMDKQLKKYMIHLGKVINEEEEYSDNALINKLSVIILIEFGGKKVLLTGDGLIKDIKDELKKMNDLEKLKIDVVKAAHHGAKKNNEGLEELVKDYEINHVFFTIDEEKYNEEKKHPDLSLLEELKKEGVDMSCSGNINRVSTNAGSLCNYMTQETEIMV